MTIYNAIAPGAAPQGELDFASGVDSQDLWFVRSGNDLSIDILGSQDQITVTVLLPMLAE